MAASSFAIIGGGIIGLAVAHRLLAQFPDLKITVFEKEKHVGQHQSSHNSGVLHAGLYYKPGSLKAQLAVTGIRQMRAFCEEHHIQHEICGKLVVATRQQQIPLLQELLRRGTENGLSGLRWLSTDEMHEIEPHAAGIAAVRVPEEGIVDYPAVCNKLQQLIEQNGGKVRTGLNIRSIQKKGNQWSIEDEVFDFLINCAGLQSDRILEIAGESRTARIVPFRGEYFLLKKEAEHLVRHLIYPVPDPQFPFLGVHFTRMIHGGVECGPNAILATHREGYSKRNFSFMDVADTIGFPGFWKFLTKYPSLTTYEVHRSFSKGEFCRSLQELVPEIQEKDLSKGGAGVRAQALQPDGTLVQDFLYVQRANALHLINAPSPGATASLAIADHLINKIA